MKLFTPIFLAIFLFANLAVLIPLASHPRKEGDWMGVCAILLMIIFAAFLPKFGRWLARDQETFLKQFVETTLEAEPEAGGVTISQRFIENKPL